MRDITLKPNTLREARAEAWVRMPADCLARIETGTIDKGDVREAARIAGLMGIKRCWELLPHCHPLPLQHSAVDFELSEAGLRIEVLVSTIGPTGVEMEALTGASIAALTVYDMLKPHAGMDLVIEGTRLLEKTGGKSDHRRRLREPRPAVILSISSAIAAGSKTDAAGDWLAGTLTEAGFDPVRRQSVAADQAAIGEAVSAACASSPALLVSCGGTGLAHDDCAVEAISPLLDYRIPGIMEAARQFGQQRTPLALMSRGIAGRCGDTLILTLPGNLDGVRESWHAVATGLVHAIGVIQRSQAARQDAPH